MQLLGAFGHERITMPVMDALATGLNDVPLLLQLGETFKDLPGLMAPVTANSGRIQQKPRPVGGSKK